MQTIIQAANGLSEGQVALAIAVLGVVGTAITAYFVYRGKTKEVDASRYTSIDEQEAKFRSDLVTYSEELKRQNTLCQDQIKQHEEEIRGLKKQLDQEHKKIELLEGINTAQASEIKTLLLERSKLQTMLTETTNNINQLRWDFWEFIRTGNVPEEMRGLTMGLGPRPTNTPEPPPDDEGKGK